MTQKNRKIADVAIIGAGITGAYAAYCSARAGLSTVLIERGKIGGQASSRNPGGLNPLHGPGIPGPMGDLAHYAFRLHRESWETFAEHSRLDFSPRKNSRILLLHDGLTESDIINVIELYQGTVGFSAQRVDRKELESQEPRLHQKITGGVLQQGNARIDARSYTQAVADAAMSFGADVCNDAVSGWVNDGHRVTTLKLGSGLSLDCDAVVIATGPWTSEVSDWLHFQLPVEPVKGQLLLARVPGGVKHDLLLGTSAIYPVSGDVVCIGGTAERVGFDTDPGEAGLNTLLANCSAILPDVELEVLEHFAGLRPITPDGMPIIGRAPDWENVYLATGAGYKGMLLSAAMASAVVDLIRDGDTQAPIGPCAMERFL